MKKLFWIFYISSITGWGQAFRGEATLPDVTSDGFYRVAVSPALGTYLNERFTNLRIYDRELQEVPYIFQKEEPAYYTTHFKSYEIVASTRQKNCCTTLILRNPDGRPINNLSLSIKNAEVTKTATLLGSDDRENWFALKQRFTVSAIDNRSKTSEVRIIDFPLSNYSYYQLQLDDSTSAPLNILSAGYYEVTSEDGKYTAIAPKTVMKADSTHQKRTYVKLAFDTTQVIDKIVLSMTGAPYFLRSATLLSTIAVTDRKGNKSVSYEPLAIFEISSKQPSVIELPGTRARELTMRIENADNPALELGSARAYQLNRYFTAWLKKGDHYTIKVGDTGMAAPQYDLGFFRDNIPDLPPVLLPGPVRLFEETSTPAAPTFFTNSIIIWIAIGAVIAVLGFMAVKMANETSKR